AKVVRSGMGSHFKHPAFSSTWDDLDAFRKRSSLMILAADSGGEPTPEAGFAQASRIALVVGNEGAGISPAARERADRTITLPISKEVESLNVAVAAGILLYTLTR
ncbi:MAG: TrmH family RNA methyltransferase, partial [Gemmatimonadaceae bacterium]